MNSRKLLRSACACVASLMLCISVQSTASAGLFRAYLASDGSDLNPCTLPQPCRLLPAALAAIADGGEIWMLDSANYNTATVTIGKSVSILAVPGAVGSVVATGGPAISIVAPSLKVALRNLVIVPLPASGATDGILMTDASTLAIEDSLIANLAGNGVYVYGFGTVKITNTILRNNAGYAVSAQDNAQVSVSGAKMLGNFGGVAVQSEGGTATAIVSDSIISGGVEGVLAYTNFPPAVARIFVTRCTIENTTYALNSGTSGGGGGSALISVSSSMITNNSYGWYQGGTGSVIKSLGNNHILDNANTAGSLTTVSLL